jgi:hypothetical protein
MSSKMINLTLESETGTGRLSETSWVQAAEVPAEVNQRMPDPAMAVPLLLERPFPTVQNVHTPLPQAGTCITSSEPIWTVDSLFNLAIPPCSWRTDLEIEIRNRWSNRQGVESIQHPTNTTQLLPIWALEFWTTMEQAITQQRQWRNALEWVLKQEECPQRLATIALIGRTPWGMRLGEMNVSKPSAFVGDIADLLSLDWIRETHLDCFAVVLNSIGTQEWWACGTSLPDLLIRSPKRLDTEFRAETILAQTLSDMDKRGANHLLMPVHMDGNHWIVVNVDIRQGTLSWGACFASAIQHHSYPLGTR